MHNLMAENSEHRTYAAKHPGQDIEHHTHDADYCRKELADGL